MGHVAGRGEDDAVLELSPSIAVRTMYAARKRYTGNLTRLGWGVESAVRRRRGGIAYINQTRYVDA
jgi:hypothetical protein